MEGRKGRKKWEEMIKGRKKGGERKRGKDGGSKEGRGRSKFHIILKVLGSQSFSEQGRAPF